MVIKKYRFLYLTVIPYYLEIKQKHIHFLTHAYYISHTWSDDIKYKCNENFICIINNSIDLYFYNKQ